MELINFVFRQFDEHKFIYDFETLELHMKECGFETVRKQSYGISASQHPPLDLEFHRLESLYAEGIK